MKICPHKPYTPKRGAGAVKSFSKQVSQAQLKNSSGFEPEVGQLCSVFKIEIIGLMFLSIRIFLETSMGLNWLCITFMTSLGH